MTEPSENPVNLEWTYHQNRSWTAGMWGVYALMPNEAILSVANKQGEGVQLGGHFPSVDEAKALAQRHQDVLSGTGEAECPTNHKAPNGQSWDDFDWFVCEGGEDYEKWTAKGEPIYKHCPDCGRLLKPEDA